MTQESETPVTDEQPQDAPPLETPVTDEQPDDAQPLETPVTDEQPQDAQPLETPVTDEQPDDEWSSGDLREDVIVAQNHRADVNPGDQHAQAEQRQRELDAEREVHNLRTAGRKVD